MYGKVTYGSLIPLLGAQWHIRVLNKQLDFCFVTLATVQFYLHERQSIKDPLDSSRDVKSGFLLVFKSVRRDGVR